MPDHSPRARDLNALTSCRHPDGGKWELAQTVHPTGSKRVYPEDDDITEDEFLVAQPEDVQPTDQSRSGSLARCFEAPILFGHQDSSRPMESLEDSAFSTSIAKPHIGKTTKKSAKGAKEKTKNAVFRALMQGMHAWPPDCLAVPLVRSRTSAPPRVQLGIDVDIVVVAYAETQVAYNVYCDGLRTRLQALAPHVKSVTFHVLIDQLTLQKFPEFKANGLGASTSGVPGRWHGTRGRLASSILQADVCCNASRSLHSQRCQQT